MNTDRENLKLLNAALADETWDSFASNLRAQTTAALRSTRLRRAILNASTQILAVVALISAIWFAVPHPASRLTESRTPAQVHAGISSEPRGATYITEDQMLAMFPKDSCVLAEINGQPQLVFLDPTRAREGFDVASASN